MTTAAASFLAVAESDDSDELWAWLLLSLRPPGDTRPLLLPLLLLPPPLFPLVIAEPRPAPPAVATAPDWSRNSWEEV